MSSKDKKKKKTKVDKNPTPADETDPSNMEESPGMPSDGTSKNDSDGLAALPNVPKKSETPKSEKMTVGGIELEIDPSSRSTAKTTGGSTLIVVPLKLK